MSQLALTTLYGSSLAPMSQVKALLLRETDPKRVADFAKAVQAARMVDGKNAERRNYWGELAIWSGRRLGELIEQGQKAGTIAKQGRHCDLQKGHDDPFVLKDILAAESDNEARLISKRAKRLLTVPEEAIREYVEAERGRGGEVTRAGVYRLAKQAKLKKTKEKHRRDGRRQIDDPPEIDQADAVEWIERQEPCDLLLTDPPYMTDVEDIDQFADAWLPTALGRVKPTGRAYVCIGAYPDELWAYLSLQPPSHLVLTNVLVWTYRNTLGPAPKLDYKLNWQAVFYYRGVEAGPLDCPLMTEQFSVQDITAPDGRHGTRDHAWQKPDELAERFVRHATKPGDVVYDCFAGTGTFLLAAARLKRIGRGCDNDLKMIAIAKERGCVLAKRS